jgi:putative spermidine/putrescine transport system permease protein
MKTEAALARRRDPWRMLLYCVCGLISFFLMLPVFIVIPMSFSSASYLQFPPPGLSLQWYQKYTLDPSWTRPTWVSFQVAIATMLLSTFLGVLASFPLVRGKFGFKGPINTFIIAPVIIPVIVISVVLYGLFSKIGMVGTRLGLVLGHSLLAIPFVVITVSATLKGFDITLEKAAMSLGASRIQTFFKVTFPLIRPGVISGALFAFIVSFDEIVISMFICGISAATLPVKMWEGIRLEINPVIAAVSTMLICLSVILLGLAEYLRSRTEKTKGISG